MAETGEKDEKDTAGGFSKSFDQYEYVAVITPGAALLLLIAWLWPQSIPWSKETEVTLGTLGILLITAYVAGQVLQSVVEMPVRFVWRLFRGMPSEWILSSDTSLLNADQMNTVFNRAGAEDGATYKIVGTDGCCARRRKFELWQAVTRRIYIKVAAAKKSGRVDAFNRTYGMMLGLTAVFAFGAAVLARRYFGIGDSRTLYEAIGLLVLAGLTLARAYAFGKLYARELYVSYLDATEPAAAAEAAPPLRVSVELKNRL